MTEISRKIDGGLFISFEGCEGAGKSTQCERVAAALRERGYKVCCTREPGGTALGEQLRTLVKHLRPADAPCPVTEMLIMGASRAQLVDRVIKPALAEGAIVICDRFADSTTVYQGSGRGLDLDFIMRMHEQCLCGRWPDLTMFLDLPVDVGFQRSRARMSDRAATDRFENEAREFHETVRSGFKRLAREFPERIKSIDATVSRDEVFHRIMEEIDHALG